MTNPYTHPSPVAMVHDSQFAETFDQLKLRIARELHIPIEQPEVARIWGKFADALRSELAKQAGSVEPILFVHPMLLNIPITMAVECSSVRLSERQIALIPITALAAQAAKIAELQFSLAEVESLELQHGEVIERLQSKNAELEAEIVQLNQWKELAFQSHPNIDLDIDAARGAK